MARLDNQHNTGRALRAPQSNSRTSVLSRECASRPCFTARVTVDAPVDSTGYRYTTSIDSNSRVETTHSLPAGQRPCLPP